MRLRTKIFSVMMMGAILLPSFSSYSLAQNLPSSAGPPGGLPNVGFMPTVPTSNPRLEAKETGITVFGVSIPISWDSIAIQIAKHTIEKMVDSTVEWINTSRDGGPAYVTEPGQYFTDIADGIAGEFIGSPESKLKFLCSPFEAQVRIALQKSYTETAPYQCRLSGVVANIEDFYDNFSAGGWDGWFAMTQENGNNPYGSYIEAKIELDSQIASAIGLEEKELGWSGGFLSTEKCEALTVPASISKSGKEECVDENGNAVPKTITTPGTAIAGQLENVLGTGLRQLELADEFDELIGALLGRLLEQTVFSAQGLLGSTEKVSTDPSNSNFPTQPTEPVCPIPTTPTSFCESVDRDVVLEIVNKYRPSNAGITEAIKEINTVYPEAKVLEHPVRLDKIDFGGGLIVDIIEGAVGGTPDAEGTKWIWGVECECGQFDNRGGGGTDSNGDGIPDDTQAF